MIAFKRKATATKCSNPRAVSFIAHTTKRVARILKTGFERKLEDVLGKGQLDASGMLRIISERKLDTNEKLCALFRVDW